MMDATEQTADWATRVLAENLVILAKVVLWDIRD